MNPFFFSLSQEAPRAAGSPKAYQIALQENDAIKQYFKSLDGKKQGFWQKALRIGKAIAAVIGALAVLIGAIAAVFALLDSASFKTFIKDLF